MLETPRFIGSEIYRRSRYEVPSGGAGISQEAILEPLEDYVPGGVHVDYESVGLRSARGSGGHTPGAIEFPMQLVKGCEKAPRVLIGTSHEVLMAVWVLRPT